ncbi:hypothetical protein CcCBS67573_g05686 [Chytriomyces confervae]|uniref:DM2 domain-containing protein n=1 Tax=Chytriomyces confervae TaxID=246404 RepID=A0A507FBT2_9FUNG|nr:SWI/SNF complex component snf12 [Chytriomyces hyalinus]TPX73047.1 hypothetical protein CcCBS67573_g05686 [Chytriomyces confervae]
MQQQTSGQFRPMPMTPQQMQQMQQLQMQQMMQMQMMGRPNMNMPMNMPMNMMGMPMNMPVNMPMGLNMNMNMAMNMNMNMNMPHQQLQDKRGPAPQTESQSKRVKRPVDRSLPSKIDSFVPEAKLYAHLLAQEKKMDAAVSSKRLDLAESLAATPKLSRTLRIFVENSATSQPTFSASNNVDDLLDFSSDSTPSWTLKVYGFLLAPDKVYPEGATPAKLSTIMRAIQVKMARETSLYADGANSVEWRKNESKQKDFDAFEVTRKGDVDVSIKIALHIDSNPEKYKLSSELADIVDVKLDTKANVIMRLWQYIKMHGLQDAEDKRQINFDDTLTKMFKTKKVLLTHLPDLLSAHLHPIEPITIDYTIKVDKPRTVSPQAYDIQVEVEDVEIKAKISRVLEGSTPASIREIALIDDEITKLVQRVTQAKHKREFMLAFSKDPVEFINNWIASQTRDLEAILGGDPQLGVGGNRINIEEARRASFYKDNWVNEAVFHYLNSV